MVTKRSEGPRKVLDCSDMIIIYHAMYHYIIRIMYVGPAGVTRPDHFRLRFGNFLSVNGNFSISLVLHICDETRKGNVADMYIHIT